MKYAVILFILCAACRLDADFRADTAQLSGAGRNEEVDRILFTDRANFAEHLNGYLTKSPKYLTDWQKVIRLADPPANSSKRTEAELRYLVELEGRRTNDEEADVVREVKVAGMKLGPYRMGMLLGPETVSPELKELLLGAQHDMEIIVFRYKAAFNRARPTHLNGRLKPSIEVPAHPAYPSGHATQAHVLAYLLAEVDPGNAAVMIEDAGQIARNREIAGVHYPSDSEAGRILARQIVDELLENEAYRRLFQLALEESRQLKKPSESR